MNLIITNSNKTCPLSKTSRLCLTGKCNNEKLNESIELIKKEKCERRNGKL